MGSSRPATRSHGEPYSVRCVDGICVAFALWTLCSHAVVFLHGSLQDLMLLFGTLASAASALWWWYGDSVGEDVSTNPGMPRRSRVTTSSVGASMTPLVLRLLPWLVLISAGIAAPWISERPLIAWWFLIASLGAGFWWSRWAEIEPPSPPRRSDEGLLWGLASISLLLVSIAHRYDLDDSFYVNLAISAATHPRAPLLVQDGLHGIPGIPLYLPVYRLNSYELWNAALSHWTGLPAIACFHFVSAGLAALLLPLSAARLLRELLPTGWIVMLGIYCAVLVACGDTHRWHANFSFVRIWQGKSIFLFVFLPMIQAHAIRFCRQPSLRRWILLASSQIAAVGCSPMALWIGPLSAAASALALGSLRPGRIALGRLLLLGASSLYVATVGLGLRQDWFEGRAAAVHPVLPAQPVGSGNPLATVSGSTGEPFGAALDAVLGTGSLRPFALFVLAASWVFCRGGAQRFASGVPLIMLLIALCPYAAQWSAENLTGPDYWRNLWTLPLPLLIALTLGAPLQWGVARAMSVRDRHGVSTKTVSRTLLCAGMVFVFATTVPQISLLSISNGVELRWPALKVPREAHAWARTLTESVRPGAWVVAPIEISPWLATFENGAQPLMVRDQYLAALWSQIGEDAAAHRMAMTRYVGGEMQSSVDEIRFTRGLTRFDIEAVCLRVVASMPRIRALLARQGFGRHQGSERYEVWVRRKTVESPM